MKRTRQIDNREDVDEFKRKISNLRVYELTEILGFFNISKIGRKSELQDRILSHFKESLDENNRKVLLENITSIYQKSSKAMSSENKRLKIAPDSGFMNGLPIQPDVKLKKNPFYEELGVLLNPSTLIPSSIDMDQTRIFIFCLTPQQAVEIDRNRVIKSTYVDYVVQAQLRLCLLETTSEQSDLYPNNLQIRVNNRICALPPFLPARPNAIPKRTPNPLNITSYVRVSASSTNTIEVRWGKESHKNFVVACFLVRKLSSEILYQRLKTKADDFTRGMIKEKLSKEVDSEIATTMLRVSLICPLGKIRMSKPCRASTCEHLQCFDAMLYLQMNECKQSWICPVCGKEALYDNLAIDGYFLNVIKSLEPDTNEIQLHKDGSWSKLNVEVEQNQTTNDLVISDDDDEDDDDKNNNKNCANGSKKNEKSSASTNEKCVKSPNTPVETVDLTLDDSD